MTYHNGTLKKGMNDSDPDITADAIKNLQKHLSECGFLLVGKADGDYGLKTELAVRELQIYLKSKTVAQQTVPTPTDAKYYSDKLKKIQNPVDYSNGFVSGEADTATQNALKKWQEKKLRCPVVIEAWRHKKNGDRIEIYKVGNKLAENIWDAKDVNSTAPRMFFRDFSDVYADQESPEREILGFMQPSKDKSFGGPSTVKFKHTAPEAEITPGNLVGKKWSELSHSQKRTFSVIRAVADRECHGFFDGSNAWDSAVLSVGIFHHTLLLYYPTVVEQGELGATLIALKDTYPDTFKKISTNYGLNFENDATKKSEWEKGKPFLLKPVKKYQARPLLQDSEGNFSHKVTTKDVGNWFRSWHWFYRAAMWARKEKNYKLSYWYICRLRIKDIVESEWGDGFDDITLPSGATRKVTIGDVFASELSIAILLRWHIKDPGHVIWDGKASGALKAIVKHAKPPADIAPLQWTEAMERKLINSLKTFFDTNEKDDLFTPFHKQRSSEQLKLALQEIPKFPSGSDYKKKRYKLPDLVNNEIAKLKLSTKRNFSYEGFDDSELP